MFGGHGKAVFACGDKTADVVLACMRDAMARRVTHEVAGLNLVDRLRGEAVDPEQSAESMRRWLASLEVSRG